MINILNDVCDYRNKWKGHGGDIDESGIEQRLYLLEKNLTKMSLKTTLNYNSGLIGEKLALSGTIVRKTGDGIIDKTWTDAWAYNLGASYAISDKQRFEMYAIGAPQRHGVECRYSHFIVCLRVLWIDNRSKLFDYPLKFVRQRFYFCYCSC